MKILDRYIDQLIEQSTLSPLYGTSKKSGRVQNPPGTILTAA